jgi:hypothetical protein
LNIFIKTQNRITNAIPLKTFLSISNTLFVIYILVLLLLTLSHEPWRDEVSPWLQTKDSSWTDIIYRSQLELQSPLYFSILKLLHYISNDYLTFRIFAFLMSIGSAFLLKKLCNNSWKLLLLSLSNYYVIYEFAAIQRIYTLAIFVLLALLYSLRKNLATGTKISMFTKVLLVSLSLVSIWMMLLSALIFVRLLLHRRIPIYSTFNLTYFAIVFAHVLFLFLSDDRDWGISGSESSELISLDNFLSMFTAPIRSLIFIPDLSSSGWNTNILVVNSLGLAVTVLLSFLFYAILFFFALKVNHIALLWIFSICSLAILVGLGKQRHLGQLFLLICTIIFLENLLDKGQDRFKDVNWRALNVIFVFTLAANLLVSSVAIHREIFFRFSTSHSLTSDLLEKDLVVVQDSGKNSYLPFISTSNIEVFSVFGGNYSQVALLNRASRTIPDSALLSKEFLKVCRLIEPSRVLLFTDSETRVAFPRFAGRLLAQSGVAIVSNEGKRELWLIALGEMEVNKLCSEPYAEEFLSGLKTQVVKYGG